jgi:hypothetical protein
MSYLAQNLCQGLPGRTNGPDSKSKQQKFNASNRSGYKTSRNIMPRLQISWNKNVLSPARNKNVSSEFSGDKVPQMVRNYTTSLYNLIKLN